MSLRNMILILASMASCCCVIIPSGPQKPSVIHEPPAKQEPAKEASKGRFTR